MRIWIDNKVDGETVIPDDEIAKEFWKSPEADKYRAGMRLERCLTYFMATEYGTWDVDTAAGQREFDRLWETVKDAEPAGPITRDLSNLLP